MIVAFHLGQVNLPVHIGRMKILTMRGFMREGEATNGGTATTTRQAVVAVITLALCRRRALGRSVFLLRCGSCTGCWRSHGGCWSSNEFHCHHFGRITHPTAGADYTRVSTWPVTKPNCNITEQLGNHRLAAQETQGTTAGRETAIFAQGNHAIGKATNFLRLRLGRFNPLMLQERGHETPKQSPAMFSLTSELSTLLFVAHSPVPFLF